MSDIDLRCGRWQDCLQDVTCDALITDPPYSERTHAKQCHGRRPEQCGGEYVSARGIDYGHFTTENVSAFVLHWAPRVTGWMAVFTDSELYSAWRDELRSVDRYVFAPIACVQVGMNVRLAGDGPSNWTTWLVVSRPRTMRAWGTLPGAYMGNPFDAGENSATASRRGSVVGSKPVWMMRQIIRDYSRPGDLICDPCAGGATTLLAAAIEGRRAIGSEMDVVTYGKAQARIARGYTPVMFQTEREPIEAKAQEMLFDGSKAGG